MIDVAPTSPAPIESETKLWFPDWLIWAGERPWVAIDFETADAERDSACAVALVRVEKGRICDQAYSLIRPPRPSEDNVHVHGLTWEMLYDQPSFHDVWRALTPTWQGCSYFVAHNAAFDRGVLHECCFRAGIDAPEQHFEDTVRLVKSVWPEWGSGRLNVACEQLGIELKHHEARSDALACAKIVIEARRRVAELLGDPSSASLGDWSMKSNPRRVATDLEVETPAHIARHFERESHLFRCFRCGHQVASRSHDEGMIRRWFAQFVSEHPALGECHNNEVLRDLHHRQAGQLRAPPLPRPAWLDEPAPLAASNPPPAPSVAPAPVAKPLKARAPRAKKSAVEKTVRKAPIESLSLFDDKGEENVG